MSRNPLKGRKVKCDRQGPCVICGDPIRKGSFMCDLHWPLRGNWEYDRPWGKRCHWRCYVEQLREYPCAYCGRWLTGRMGVDHITPTSRGGLDTPDNMAPCCAECNSSKGQNTPEEWMGPG